MPSQVAELKPAAYNPRKISKAQLAALGKAMREFGDLGGIVVNVRTGHVVGGHQRLKHLDPKWEIEKSQDQDSTGTVAEGWIQTPWGRISYREVDWDETKEKAANIAANAHGGDFDLDLLRPILSELKIDGLDLELTGLDQLTLDKLLPLEENAAADVTPGGHIVSRSKPGTLWQLGRHMLLCGDASKSEDVGRIVKNNTLAGVITSPPYDNDEAYEKGYDRSQWLSLISSFTRVWTSGLMDGGAFALNMGNRVGSNNIGWCGQCLERADLTFQRRVVWKKPDGAGIPTHGHTHKNPAGLNWNPIMVTEDILIYTRGNKRKVATDERFDTALFAHFYTDCWQFRGVTSDKKQGHPAAFPVMLPQMLMSFLTLKGELIGEPFCGSGSTIIAAEITGRTCVATEKEPKYCDLAVARWEQFTGKKAILASGK